MFNLRGVLSGVAYDPKDPKVIFVTNNALWKSTNTGRTWTLLFPDPGKNTVEHMRDDHASHSFTTDDPVYRGVTRIFAVTIDPRDPTSTFLAAGGRQGRWLLHSKDGGKSWERAGDIDSQQVFFLSVDPVSSDVLIGPDGVRRARSGGVGSGAERKFLAVSAGGVGTEAVFYATAAATWRDGRLAGAI